MDLIIALPAIFLLVFGAFAVFGVLALFAKREADAVEFSIEAGDASRLADFQPGALAWLSKDVVGAAWYWRPPGGARTSKLVATVPAYEGDATLLALRAESTPRHGQARIDLLSRGPRMRLVLDGGVWRVALPDGPFGIVDPSTGRLGLPSGRSAGWYKRTAAGAQVHVGGADVAWIYSDAALHHKRRGRMRPLLTLASPAIDPDAALWVLAVVAIELASALLIGSAAPMGVP